jgi:ribonucleotide monophosphatase NagD (HAD superfamily)
VLAGSTKREPIVVGKPAEFMLENIATQFGLQRSQICMVGDRLDTDILFGKNGGLATILCLSGELHALVPPLLLLLLFEECLDRARTNSVRAHDSTGLVGCWLRGVCPRLLASASLRAVF